MAGSARRLRVRPREREPAEVVIELRALPLRGRVAGFASGGEVAVAMIWIGRLFKIRQVTAGAVSRRTGELSTHMARCAVGLGVGSREGERGGGIVVEHGAGPRVQRMAGIAVLGKSRSHVIGVLGFGELLGMAAEALHGRAGKTRPRVARLAVHPRMGSLQREPGKLGVIESRAPEGVHPVAGFAARRQLRSYMIQRTAALIILLMTGVAVRIQPRVDSAGGSFVAGFAGRQRVRAQKREPVQVIANGLHPDPPTLDGMAVLARRRRIGAGASRHGNWRTAVAVLANTLLT